MVTQNQPMSLVLKGKKACRALDRAIVRTWKYILRVLTRQGELERIIREVGGAEGRGRSADLVQRVAFSLGRSYNLGEVKVIVFGKSPFSVSATSAKIAEEDGISDVEVVATLVWCLQVRGKSRLMAPKSVVLCHYYQLTG